MATLEQRILNRIIKRENGCWEWTGARAPHGYGRIRILNKVYPVHRLAYELWVVSNPQGKHVFHRCNNPACCNPDHLSTSKHEASLEERLLDGIVKRDNGCWEWQGPFTHRYGQISDQNRRHRAHRLAYELWVGPIPQGLSVLHKCNNPPCCNPAHLFVGTQKENVQHSAACEREYYQDLTQRGYDIGQGLIPSTQGKIKPEDILK
jgi:hypothetical protein